LAAPLVLYDYLFSGNCYKVRLLLRQLELAYERRPVDVVAGETRRTEFLRKNPVGQVPVLELADGTLLRQSNAILMHVAEGTPLLPPEKLERARVLEWLCFEQSQIAPIIGRARFRRAFPDAVPTRPEEFQAWQEVGHRALRVLEMHLQDYTFLVGERYSIADIGVYAYTHCAHQGGFELLPYPSVRSWIERVAEQPGYFSIDQLP
jgi:glutathione S-transferase